MDLSATSETARVSQEAAVSQAVKVGSVIAGGTTSRYSGIRWFMITSFNLLWCLGIHSSTSMVSRLGFTSIRAWAHQVHQVHQQSCSVIKRFPRRW